MMFAQDGLILGGMLVARHPVEIFDSPGSSRRGRLDAMLAVAFRKRLGDDHLRHIAAAADHASRGKHVLANLRLVFAGLSELPEPDAIGTRLAWTAELLDGGMRPDFLLKAFDLTGPDDLACRYHPDQPRVPAGSGRESGRWSDGSGSGSNLAVAPHEPNEGNARTGGAGDPKGLLHFAALGDVPPPPPGYDPKTWTQDILRNGKIRLTSPDGTRWIMHVEDLGHWRHWGVRGPGNDDQGSWPKQSGKPRRDQIQPPYGIQGLSDPSGDAKPWAEPKNEYVLPLNETAPPIIGVPRTVPFRIPMFEFPLVGVP